MVQPAAYLLEVHFGGGPTPRERRRATTAAEVLELIPQLLAQHAGCERIAVYNGATLLFAVDCEGNRVAP